MRDEIKDRMEPGIHATGEGFRASLAISAKRQADALERIADLAELLAAQRFNLGPRA